jgi:hypothetical protein
MEEILRFSRAFYLKNGEKWRKVIVILSNTSETYIEKPPPSARFFLSLGVENS